MKNLRNQNSDAVVLRWRGNPPCVGLARMELSKALADWGLGELSDPALLVLSELLTNSVTHGRVPGREIETRFLSTGDGLRIEVHDASSARPQKLDTDLTRDSDGGRGLLIVETLADQWGVRDRDGVGKLVWASFTSAPGSNGGGHGG
ncbi:ATP-binding protein [Streptomyces sp. NPDC059255]|uniref:ATP-binding protein n=1 Tax=Streptomyces sp. NPDC059255 TaxID=3346793 RepID=UPI0036C22CD3